MPPSTWSTSQADTEVSCRVLTNLECRSWISNQHEGRLRYETGRGPRAVAVRYAVTDDQVVSRAPEYNEIGQYAPGRPITMRVSALTADTCTEVVVAGIGHLADDQAQIAQTTDLPNTGRPACPLTWCASTSPTSSARPGALNQPDPPSDRPGQQWSPPSSGNRGRCVRFRPASYIGQCGRDAHISRNVRRVRGMALRGWMHQSKRAPQQPERTLG